MLKLRLFFKNYYLTIFLIACFIFLGKLWDYYTKEATVDKAAIGVLEGYAKILDLQYSKLNSFTANPQLIERSQNLNGISIYFMKNQLSTELLGKINSNCIPYFEAKKYRILLVDSRELDHDSLWILENGFEPKYINSISK